MDTPEDPLMPFQPQILSEKRVHPQLLFHWENLSFNIGAFADVLLTLYPSHLLLLLFFFYSVLTLRQSRAFFHDCCAVRYCEEGETDREF